MKYFLKYKVQNFEGEFTAGPYTAENGELAAQRNDIRGFEGVYDVQTVTQAEEEAAAKAEKAKKEETA